MVVLIIIIIIIVAVVLIIIIIIMTVALREDPNGLTPPPFGHCPNSDWTPPLAFNWALWGTFFRAIFTILQGCMLPKTVSAPNHLGKRLDPPKNKDMPI